VSDEQPGHETFRVATLDAQAGTLRGGFATSKWIIWVEQLHTDSMSDDDRSHKRRRRGRRRRRRRSDGQFAETVGLDDVLAVFGAVDGPVVTTTDVAAEFDISTEAARTKLNELVDREDLRRRETGRTVVYWESSTGDRATTEDRA
jgi:hypothetical protein